MYTHLLVPLDDSALAVVTIGQAVDFARGIGARITFFHARADYGATGEGELNRLISPETFGEKSAGEARAILAKAEAAARAADVPCDAVAKTSDRPAEAILEIAEAQGCDLIFMASHGRGGIRGLLLGSQTQKVLVRTRIPVLVAAVESNRRESAAEAAITLIKDEHRSIAAVVHGLQFVVKEAREHGEPADFGLLRAMLFYLKTFAEKLHHPKEDGYLFRKLRQRTAAFEDTLFELERQHKMGCPLVEEMEDAIDCYQGGSPGGWERLAEVVERFAEIEWLHMGLEENIILPAALEHLTDEDWAEIAAAFAGNGDPRFDEAADEGFRRMFARLMNLAPAAAI